MLQSGFAAYIWDLAALYSAIALSVAQPAPLLPWETDANNRPIESAREKAKQTCWEAFHNGHPVQGPKQPFGRLCYYLCRGVRPAMPTTVLGIFLGWRIDSGVRCRGILVAAEYDKMREQGFQS